MNEAILTVNAGSSSIKFAVFRRGPPVPQAPEIAGQIDGIGARPHLKVRDASGAILEDGDLPPAGDAPHRAALGLLLDWMRGRESGWRVAAVGHRVVHGGARYSQPVRVDERTIEALRTFCPLAPLHQPHNLAGIEAMTAALKGVPQVACFDTAFHRTQPPVAQLFALPRRITAEGVRRYGFHGLSYEYIAHKLREHDPALAEGRVVVAHLGSGASMCALHDGRSMDSTLGFTAVDGLPMGTRTGQLDPGVVLYLVQNRGYDAARLERFLYHEGGLKGLSGVSNDMRDLEASDAPGAKLAIDYFVYRILKETGALAAAMGGIDGLVFTAGIGEHSALVRGRVVAKLAWLGAILDAPANAAHRTLISTPDSELAVLVLPTDEELMIARHTLRLLRPKG